MVSRVKWDCDAKVVCLCEAPDSVYLRENLAFEQASEAPEEFIKTQVAGPNRFPDSAEARQGLTMCISNEFPGEAAAACAGTTV